MFVRSSTPSEHPRREGRTLAHGTRELLRRALDDMNEAVRAALGLDPARPHLVRELVDDPGRRPAPRRNTRPPTRRRWRRRPAHLTLVR